MILKFPCQTMMLLILAVILATRSAPRIQVMYRLLEDSNMPRDLGAIQGVLPGVYNAYNELQGIDLEIIQFCIQLMFADSCKPVRDILTANLKADIDNASPHILQDALDKFNQRFRLDKSQNHKPSKADIIKLGQEAGFAVPSPCRSSGIFKRDHTCNVILGTSAAILGLYDVAVVTLTGLAVHNAHHGAVLGAVGALHLSLHSLIIMIFVALGASILGLFGTAIYFINKCCSDPF